MRLIRLFFKSAVARKRLFLERITEPFHLNVIAFFAFLFGSFRHKVACDLISKQPYAFGILKAADIAKSQGIFRIKVIEFGVGQGHGLLKMQYICEKVTKITGVEIDIYGFDIVEGMPSVKSYKDSPEAFRRGSYKTNLKELLPKLKNNVDLVIGDVEDTIGPWVESLSNKAPIGFISFDLDMYYGTKAALKVLNGNSDCYLPFFWVYLDDIRTPATSNKIGELLAVDEFNDENDRRSISVHPFLACDRMFKNPSWLHQMRIVNVFDHPTRS